MSLRSRHKIVNITRTIVSGVLCGSIFWRLLPKKRKRSCPISSAKTRPKKSKKSFDREWASKLAVSDKGWFYKQEKWMIMLVIRQAKMLLFLQAAPRYI